MVVVMTKDNSLANWYIRKQFRWSMRMLLRSLSFYLQNNYDELGSAVNHAYVCFI